MQKIHIDTQAMVFLILTLFVGPVLLWSALYLLRLWMRGPTTGSDSKVWLKDRVVVITGMLYSFSYILLMINKYFAIVEYHTLGITKNNMFQGQTVASGKLQPMSYRRKGLSLSCYAVM